jgi:hypothetical protein
MQKWVVEHFLQNHQVVLQGLGKLSLQYHTTHYDFGAQSLSSPKPYILFSKSKIEDSALAKFVAQKEKISETEASKKVNDFIVEIRNLSKQEKYFLPNIGFFTLNETAELIFESTTLSNEFFPPVNATKVVHPTDTHEILVGDTQTNTAVMSEYYANDSRIKKISWWVWALVFAVIGFGTLFYSLYKNGSKNSFFGNTQSILNTKKDSTYQLQQP